jgi:NAD(P)-dependent dehydrogenase (short-subunit alcohol dehydrogenase family)
MTLVLVTGASSGLGHGATKALADSGHDLVIHLRTPTPQAGARDRRWAGVVSGDLSQLDEVRSVAAQAASYGRFDAAIHNAGTMRLPEAITVNTVAPYLLTALMPRPGRLVYLSSSMHRGGSTDLRRVTAATGSYSDTKLWVTTLASTVAERWPGTASHAVDPGWVPTRMGGAGAPDDLVAGHQTQVWLATGDDVEPPTGGYWHHRRLEEPHPASQDPRFQAQLVDALQTLTDVPLN